MEKHRKNKRSITFTWLLLLFISLTSVGTAQAQATPILQSATFFGGPGDQRGTGIAISGGAIYISGNVQPGTQAPSDSAFVLRYPIPLPPGSTPVWSRSFGFGTNFFGIAATTEGVYADGWNYSLSSDPVGGKEVKSIMAKFAADGTSGPGPGGSIWARTPNFFIYSGVEVHEAATTVLERGSTFIYTVGEAQPCSYIAYDVAKYDTAGNLIAAATDSSVGISFNRCFVPSFGGSSPGGVTVLNGNIYVGGSSRWASEGESDGRPAIWKYDSNLNLIWRLKDTTLVGGVGPVTAFQNAIYAVGATFIPGVPNSEDFLIEKYDEAGNLLWRQISGGAGTDALSGIIGIGSRLFAVGYTTSQGAGGTDVVILEVDPTTGATLSTTLYGGPLDEFPNGVATDGTDLYIVGESRSFASPAGNAVGQNDVMLLRYSVSALQALINSLSNLINSLNLSPQQKSLLLGYVQQIPTVVSSLTAAQKAAAIAAAKAFIAQVSQLLSLNLITAAQANQLISLANQIIAVLSS